MFLVRRLAGEIVEEQNLGRTEARVHDVAFFGAGRHSEMRAAHGLDVREPAQSCHQLRQIFLRSRILQPEENVVNQLGMGIHGAALDVGGCDAAINSAVMAEYGARKLIVGGLERAAERLLARTAHSGYTDSNTANLPTSAAAIPVQALPIAARRGASGSTIAMPALACRAMKRIQAAMGMTSRWTGRPARNASPIVTVSRTGSFFEPSQAIWLSRCLMPGLRKRAKTAEI